MSPTLRKSLIPKDKLDVAKTVNCVYEIPCKSCPQTYVGETKRQFGRQLKELKSEAEKAGKQTFTRAQRKESLTELSPTM